MTDLTKIRFWRPMLKFPFVLIPIRASVYSCCHDWWFGLLVWKSLSSCWRLALQAAAHRH
jgi:hypothetical protein